MIVRDPDPVLREVCDHVAPLEDARAIADELRTALLWSAQNGRPGIGLAAPQIGIRRRVFVLAGFPHAFVNPRVLKTSVESAVEQEGCLSLPAHLFVEVTRAKWVKLAATDETGAARTFKLHARDARAALHELDHLDGILITDRAA